MDRRQQEAWDSAAGSIVIPAAVQTAQGFELPRLFDRAAPLVIEIGFGVGEALISLAAARPECNIVGFEVWQPGVADCLAALSDDVRNVRLSTLDAAWCFEHVIPTGSVSELWTFFPDPWPKARHHKRRLINPRFAALVADRLACGGAWRLATDWPHYAEQMRGVLDNEPALAGGITDRYAGRPLTRFERRGLTAGRPVTDLTYRRR